MLVPLALSCVAKLSEHLPFHNIVIMMFLAEPQRIVLPFLWILVYWMACVGSCVKGGLNNKGTIFSGQRSNLLLIWCLGTAGRCHN